jgi:hypothetical protein
MIIISGSSPKMQVLGYPTAPCAACKQETLHRFQRHYRVKHLFWFPLFSMGTNYAKVCERCQLYTPTGAPAGAVPPAPFLHRLGFVFPLALMLFPIVTLPLALMHALNVSPAASSGAQAAVADTEGPSVSFRSDAKDEAAVGQLEKYFDDLGLRGIDVASKSAKVDGHTVRLVTAKYSRLKKVSDGDRLRLLQHMEDIADDTFPGEEVFVGLQGRLLWGGYSHANGGEKWVRVVDESTADPEADARAAVRALERAASPKPSAPAAAAAGADAP